MDCAASSTFRLVSSAAMASSFFRVLRSVTFHLSTPVTVRRREGETQSRLVAYSETLSQGLLVLQTQVMEEKTPRMNGGISYTEILCRARFVAARAELFLAESDLNRIDLKNSQFGAGSQLSELVTNYGDAVSTMVEAAATLCGTVLGCNQATVSAPFTSQHHCRRRHGRPALR